MYVWETNSSKKIPVIYLMETRKVVRKEYEAHACYVTEDKNKKIRLKDIW